MVVRTTGQAKRDAGREDIEAGPSRAAAGAKKAKRAHKAAAKAPVKKAAVKKTAKKAVKKSAGQAKAARAGKKSPAKRGQTETQMLAEQNAALKAELKRAEARIKELEALNADVINRIDWVIDSLQTVVEDKR